MNDDRKVNFDLQKMIDDFDWYDFMAHGATKISYGIASGDEFSNGAILIITNKQYVLSYTEGYGQGNHYDTAYRIMKDLHGGGFMTYREAKRSHGQLHNYIWARSLFENGYGAITFMDLNNLNSKNYEVFYTFYNDYNETIKMICQKYNFVVRFTYRDNENKLVAIESKSLDELLYFLQNHPNKNLDANSNDDEVIIGRSVDNNLIK